MLFSNFDLSYEKDFDWKKDRRSCRFGGGIPEAKKTLLYTNGLLPALRLSCFDSLLARATRALLAFTSLALPDDSVSFRPEPLLVSSIFNLDLKPVVVVLEPEELADSHGFVRIRERSRGD